METHREIENGLILAVCHLCDRVRELADSGTRDPVALVPLQEAVSMIAATLESLGVMWEKELEGPFPCTPTGEKSPEEDWLLDEDVTDAAVDGGAA